MMRSRTLLGALLLLAVALATTPASADLFWSGDGTWDTTTASWGTATGGPYGTATWDNDAAVFEGIPGTVTLGEDITLNSMTFNSGSGYFIDGGTLNFAPGATITNAVANTNHTITSAITGSPTVRIADNSGANYQGFTFAPENGTVTLGTCLIPFENGTGDKGGVTLGGSTTGNSVSEVMFEGGNRYGRLSKEGSGTWTVGDVDVGIVYVDNGTLVAEGTIGTHYQSVYLRGGEFHFNNPLAIGYGRSGTVMTFQGGALDNTSGAAIAVPADDGADPPNPVYQPKMNWTGSGFTFIGSNDLDLGTGAVTLSGNATATIDASTLTIGGAISDGANAYGLTKAGAGTLILNGTNSYDGDTTVSAGMLSLGTASMSDTGSTIVASGATMDLNFAGVDDVFRLELGGTTVAAGEWGSPTSGAANTSPLLAGTGIINTLGGIWADGRMYWDGPNVGGDGDGISDGGAGTWSTTNANWDKGFTAREGWNNTTSIKAIFGGSGGTVTVAEDITLKEILFTGGNYTISGGTLNFAADGVIDMAAEDKAQTITSAITGSPAVRIASGEHNPYNQLTFAPDVGTQTLGDVRLSYEDGRGDKCRLTLGGSTDGNTVGGIAHVEGGHHYSLVEKTGTGSWTINGDVNAGVGDVVEGTLTVNGEWRSLYQGMRAIDNGAKLSGNMTYFQNDARFGYFTVGNGGIVAPGDNGIGTMTSSYGTGRGDEAFTNFNDGSIYEWEIGDGETDTFHIARDQDVLRPRTLNLDNFVLKILDTVGATGIANGQYPVFTYDAGVNVDMTGFGNTAANFDTSGLSAAFTVGTLSLTDDGNGLIYLTGLSSFDPTDFDQDGNSDLIDINALTAVANLPIGLPVALSDPKYDLTGDDMINTADLDKWLTDAATINGFGSPYLKGDANLDGDVDVFAIDGSGDAQILSSNLGTASGAVWGDGDFNGDGDVDVFAIDGSGDAQLLSSNLGSSSDATAGTAEAIYNALTGELSFDVGEGIAVIGVQAEGLDHAAVDAESNLGAPAQNGGGILAYFNASGLKAGMADVGAVLPTGLTAEDIGFSFTPIGGDSTVVPVTVVVPEPSTIAMLLVLGAVALCWRRRNA